MARQRHLQRAVVEGCFVERDLGFLRFFRCGGFEGWGVRGQAAVHTDGSVDSKFALSGCCCVLWWCYRFGVLLGVSCSGVEFGLHFVCCCSEWVACEANYIWEQGMCKGAFGICTDGLPSILASFGA